MFAVAMIGGAAACGRGPGDGERVPVGPPPSPAAPELPAPAVFDVHEWGVLDVDARGAAVRAAPPASLEHDVARLLRGGAPGPRLGDALMEAQGLGKPVLYVHLAPGTEEASIDVGVTLGGSGARIVERWPGPPEPPSDPPSDGSARVRWTGVRVRRGACPEGAVSFPPPNDGACAGVADGVCERAELARFVTRDADCLEVAGEAAADGRATVRAPLLFYRGRAQGAPLPLSVALGPGGAVTVAHPGAGTPVGRLVHVRPDPKGVRARTVARVVDGPAPGGAVTLPPLAARRGARGRGAEETGDAETALAALDEGLRGAGLTASEVATFHEVWDAELVGPGGPGDAAGEAAAAPGADAAGGGRAGRPRARSAPAAGGGAGGLAAQREELWYFLPPEAAAEVARLDVAPPPRAVRRALLVRVRLTSGAGEPAPASAGPPTPAAFRGGS